MLHGNLPTLGSMMSEINGSNILYRGAYWGVTTALTAGAAAFLQNRINFVEFFKQLDPTYAAPSFKAGCMLGIAPLAIELVSRPIEVLTKPNVPKFSTNKAQYDEKLKAYLPAARKEFLHKLVLTAAKTFLFVKGAEAIVNQGWPIHRGFIYQIAFLYATENIGGREVRSMVCLGFGMVDGAFLTGLIWLAVKIGLVGALQRLNRNVVIPPYSQIFAWVVVFSSLAKGSVVVSRDVIEMAFGPKKAQNNMNMVLMAKGIMEIFIAYRMTQTFSHHDFSILFGVSAFFCSSAALIHLYREFYGSES